MCDQCHKYLEENIRLRAELERVEIGLAETERAYRALKEEKKNERQ